MKKPLLDEVRQYFDNERRTYTYFKDKHCVDTLKRFIGDSKSVQSIRHSHCARFLQKPWIKAQLARVGQSVLTPAILDSWWRDDVYYFNQTFGEWGGEDAAWQQTTRHGYNLVLQLNLTQSHNRDYERWVIPNNPGLYSRCYHPVNQQGSRHTLAWIRIDLSDDLSDALIEEIQTDWLRDADASLQFLKCSSKAENVALNDSDMVRYERYFAKHLKPLTGIWAEASINAALNFLFEEIGVKRVYYHEFKTGLALKHIDYGLPPRSLYSSLPKQLGFTLTEELPAFLLAHNNVRNALKKVSKPTIYCMTANGQL